MTPARETLLAYVAGTSLAAINGTAPFTTTVREVKRNLAALKDFQVAAGLPGISMIDKGETVNRRSSNARRFYDLQLTLFLFCRVQPGTAGDATLNSFVGDVIYAMTSDSYRTHGSNAVHTEYQGMDVIDVETANFAGAAMDFALTYYNSWNTP